MKKLFTLFILIIVIGIQQTYAKPIVIKEQMQQNAIIMDYFDNDVDAAFCYYFKKTVDDGNAREIEEIPVIQWNDTSISKENYETIFKHKKSVDISKEECKVSTILCDSICAYYGISMEELGKIRQSKHLINKKKKEVNELFNNCLKIINEKFIKDKKTTTINEDKLAELITEKLIQKQNESSIPTIPDCPSLI